MTDSVAGFFSYAPADNAGARNRILRLAELIRDEYSLVTGTDLTLITDRAGPRWTEEWDRRVRSGFDPATCFVPVITPRYFRDPRCRRELLNFTTAARAHGAADLVLPIVYTNTRELNDPASADDVVALVRRMRCERWQDLRTDDETSAAHRRAVCRLTTRLATVVERMSARHNGVRALDVVGALADAVPRWDDAFGVLAGAMTRIDVLTEKLTLEMASTPFDRSSAAGQLAILRSYADEIMKPARDVLCLGNAFATEVIGLDPGVLALLHENHPENDADFVEQCRSLIRTTTRQLRHTADQIRDYGSRATAVARRSEVLDDPLNDVALGVRSMLDGITLISEWEHRMTSPGGQTE